MFFTVEGLFLFMYSYVTGLLNKMSVQTKWTINEN